ncbi:MAG: peptidoglycan-binding protein [Candidatus Colwellbacteria bacterium]|nr:peptidoglycan-binding protein [Candidatus Colwellbacteria bacterium]
MRIFTLSLFIIAILLLNGSVVYGATTAELQAQITALLQQVQALQSQLPSSTPSTFLAKEPVALIFPLRQGSTDAATNGEVTKLQQFLAQDKTIYPEGLITGYFGNLTETAVKRFQSQNGIVSIGVVGPQTREAIRRITTPVSTTPSPNVTSTTATSTAVTSTTATSTTPTAPPITTPSLGSIILSPSSGQVAETVTITGSGFTATGNDVYFGSGAIKNLNSFNGGTMITFQIPTEIDSTKIFIGTYNIYVSNSNGKTATSTFTIISGASYPSIISASPNIAKVGDTITVYGSGFAATGNEVHLGVGGMRIITILSQYKETILTFRVPPSINSCDFPTSSCSGKTYSVIPGDYSLYIVNTNGQSNSEKFTVTAY